MTKEKLMHRLHLLHCHRHCCHHHHHQ
jgi:hypothetical protein